MTSQSVFEAIFSLLGSTPNTQFTVGGDIHHTKNNEQHDILQALEADGYWGASDSTVDWCEPNYVVTIYIAEFFNTISSVPIVIWALLGFYLCYKNGVREKRYLCLLLSLALIGCGSILFHSTLRYHAQVMFVL